METEELKRRLHEFEPTGLDDLILFMQGLLLEIKGKKIRCDYHINAAGIMAPDTGPVCATCTFNNHCPVYREYLKATNENEGLAKQIETLEGENLGLHQYEKLMDEVLHWYDNTIHPDELGDIFSKEENPKDFKSTYSKQTKQLEADLAHCKRTADEIYTKYHTAKKRLHNALQGKDKLAAVCVDDIKQIFATYMLKGGNLESPIGKRLEQYNTDIGLIA